MRQNIIKLPSFFKSHFLFRYIVLGLLVRYVIGLFTYWPPDISVWYKTSLNILNGNGIYGRGYFSYPPVWGYCLTFFVFIGSLFVNPYSFGEYLKQQLITSPKFQFLWKTPILISELLVGYILYRIVLDFTKDIRKAQGAFLMWYLNPFVFFINAVVGQFSSLCLLFLLLSLCFLLEQCFFLAGITLMFGIMTKLFPIYFLPLELGLIISLSHKQTKLLFFNIFLFFIGLLIAGGVILLPLIINHHFENFYWCLLGVRQSYTGGIGGFSLYFLRHIPNLEKIVIFLQKYPQKIIFFQNIAILFGLTILFSLIIFSKKKDFIKCFTFGSIFTLILVYLFTPLVQPQYLIWIFPFLIISILKWDHLLSHWLNILTYAALLFNLSILGPWKCLLPLAHSLKVLDAEKIFNITQDYINFPGLFHVLLREDFLMISSTLGVISLCYLLIYSLKQIVSFTYNK